MEQPKKSWLYDTKTDKRKKFKRSLLLITISAPILYWVPSMLESKLDYMAAKEASIQYAKDKGLKGKWTWRYADIDNGRQGWSKDK